MQKEPQFRRQTIKVVIAVAIIIVVVLALYKVLYLNKRAPVMERSSIEVLLQAAA